MADRAALAAFQSLLPEEKKAVRDLIAKGVDKHAALYKVSGEGQAPPFEGPGEVITSGASAAPAKTAKQLAAQSEASRAFDAKNGAVMAQPEPDMLDSLIQGAGQSVGGLPQSAHAAWRALRYGDSYDDVKAADNDAVRDITGANPGAASLGLGLGMLAPSAATPLLRLAGIAPQAASKALAPAASAAGRLAQGLGRIGAAGVQGAKAGAPLGALAGFGSADKAADIVPNVVGGTLAGGVTGGVLSAAPALAGELAPRLSITPVSEGAGALARAAGGDVLGNVAGALRLVGENPKTAGGLLGSVLGNAGLPGIGGLGGGAAVGATVAEKLAPDMLAAAERMSPAPLSQAPALPPARAPPTNADALPVDPVAMQPSPSTGSVPSSGLSLQTPSDGVPIIGNVEGFAPQQSVPRLRLSPISDTEPGLATGNPQVFPAQDTEGLAWFQALRDQSRGARPTETMRAPEQSSEQAIGAQTSAGHTSPLPRISGTDRSPLADIADEQAAARGAMGPRTQELSDRGLRLRYGSDAEVGAEKGAGLDADMRASMGRDLTPQSTPSPFARAPSTPSFGEGPSPEMTAQMMRGYPAEAQQMLLAQLKQFPNGEAYAAAVAEALRSPR